MRNYYNRYQITLTATRHPSVTLDQFDQAALWTTSETDAVGRYADAAGRKVPAGVFIFTLTVYADTEREALDVARQQAAELLIVARVRVAHVHRVDAVTIDRPPVVADLFAEEVAS